MFKKVLTSSLALLLFFSSTSYAYKAWRYREHATDCTALTDGKESDICRELDSERWFGCYPSAGDCDTAGEWVLLNKAGGGITNLTLPVQSAKLTGSFVTNGDASQGAGIDAGDGNWRLLFDDTTDEGAVWQFVMPDNYSSTPTLTVHFSMASGEANEVEFEGSIMCYTTGTDTADVGTASFAAVDAGTATTVSATAGEAYQQTITLTDDSCAAGDVVWIQLSTDADDATNDDATGDREVIAVEFGYTAS